MFKQRLYGTLVMLIVLPFVFHDAVRIAREVDSEHGITATFINTAPSTVRFLSLLQGSRQAGTLSSAGVPGKGDYSLQANGQQTLSAEEIDAILEGWNSPAQRSGYLWVKAGEKYDIDAAISLAMFEFESGAGSNPNWDASSMNPGNIRATSNRFRRYEGWGYGIDDMVALLASYRDDYGITNVRDALNRWAPPVENDTSAYVDYVQGRLDTWRSAKQGQFVAIGTGEEQQQTVAPLAVNLPEGEKVRSEPLPMDGFGVYNQDTMQNTIRYSIEASPGLQSVTIPPGATWSFMAAWTVDVGQLATEYGVLGAGMCDVAARYSNAAHKLGLGTVSFVDHRNNGVILKGVPIEDNVAVFGTPGVAGGTDLTITNDRPQTVKMAGVFEGGDFVVYGWYEG